MKKGADVGQPLRAVYAGVPVEEWPRVVLSPSFAPTTADVAAKVSRPGAVDGAGAGAAGGVALAPRSVLVVEGPGVRIRGLKVDGALVIRAAEGAEVVVDGLEVENKGWRWAPIEEVRASRSLRSFAALCCFVSFVRRAFGVVSPRGGGQRGR